MALRTIARKVWYGAMYVRSQLYLMLNGCKQRGQRIYLGSGVSMRNASSLSVQDDVYIGRSCRVISEGPQASISIGPRTVILEHSFILSQGGWIKIGADCSVNHFCVLYGGGGLSIGDGVRIASHTVIIPQNHVFANPNIPIHQQPLSGRGVRIEDDVWIGAHCTILDGVTIGKGSVIGAGSVVTRNIPEYSVAVGAPARSIRSRKMVTRTPEGPASNPNM